MKTNLKIAVLALLIAGAVTFTAAELSACEMSGGHGQMGQGYSHMGPGYNGYEYLKSRLGLSENQVEKIYKINLKYMKKYFDNRKSKEKISSLKVEHKKEIDSVYTKKQKEIIYSKDGHGKSCCS